MSNGIKILLSLE